MTLSLNKYLEVIFVKREEKTILGSECWKNLVYIQPNQSFITNSHF